MKPIITIILVSGLICSSCSQRIDDTNIVKIYRKIDTQSELSWVWVRVEDWVYLSSAHVVRNNRYSYLIQSWASLFPVRIVAQDNEWDRVLLTTTNNPWTPQRTIDEFLTEKSNIKNGDKVYTYLTRSGSLSRIDGTIIEVNAKTLGYTQLWQTYMLSWIVLTDLEVLPGESGAPIFSSRGGLIDVVHVAQ